MNKEEVLKAIMELPKIETDNPISAMNSINVDDLMSAVDRLNKVPDYNDLLKENQELKKKYENAVADYENAMFEKNELKKQVETYEIEGYTQNEELNKMSFDIRKYKVQQKEFINYLEDNWKQTQDIWYIKILQKYREIIGE